MSVQLLLFPGGSHYTLKEVAQRFGRSLATVYRWRKALGLGAVGPTARTLFVTAAELEKLMQPRPAPAVAKAKRKAKR